MARLEKTIKSRKLGRDVTFSIPGDRYIYADLNGESGTLGEQICYGGELSGTTLIYEGEEANEFGRICQNWLNTHFKKYSFLYSK